MKTDWWFVFLLFVSFGGPNVYAQNSRIDSIIHQPFDVMVSNLEKSESAMREAYRLASINGHVDWAGEAAKELSTIHYLRGAYDSSAYYIVEAIKIFEQQGLHAELGDAYCEYGYRIKRRNLKEAFRYMLRGIVTLEKYNHQGALTGAYDNYGVLHEMNNSLDSAEFFYTKGLMLKEQLRDSIGLPYSLNNLGGVCLMRGRYDEAFTFFEKGLKIRLQRNDSFGVAESHALLGDLYKAWKKYLEAIQWYELSAAECERISYPFLLQQNQEQLAWCYEQTGRFDLATRALRRSNVLKDSLLNEKNLQQINELEQRFRVVEKDKSIALLQEKAARRQSIIALISAIVILLIAVAFILFQRHKRKASEARDAAIIEERERGLEAVFAATEEERKRIAKDLHDGVGQQLSGLRMGFESLTSEVRLQMPQKAEVIDNMTKVIDEACKDVRSLSHQMMPKALMESGLIASIEDMLHKSLGLTQIQFKLEHFKVEGQRFPEKVEIGLYRVCQELVNNIIKHSQASEVVVQLFRSKGYLILIVEDNGRGFEIVKGQEGIGLSNITSRMHTVDGDVTWEPGPQNGTVATVKVPVGH